MYLQRLVLVKPLLLPAAIVEELELVLGVVWELIWFGAVATEPKQINPHTTLKPVTILPR